MSPPKTRTLDTLRRDRLYRGRIRTPEETQRIFTTNEVSQLACVTLRQLQWWDERKVVSPRHEGHRRIYYEPEVVEIAVIAELRRKGFSLQAIRRVLRFMQKKLPEFSEFIDAGKDVYLVTDGRVAYFESSCELVIDILNRAKRPMMLVSVSDLARGVKAVSERK